MRPYSALATIAGFAVCKSLGGASDVQMEADTERNETKWEFSLSSFTYLAQHERGYVNPNYTADYDRLPLETRYNYEALKTGSVWMGYNFPSSASLRICRSWRLKRPVAFLAASPGCRPVIRSKLHTKSSRPRPKQNIFSTREQGLAISSTAGRSSVRRCQTLIASEPVWWSNEHRPRAIPTSGADRSSV